MMFNRLVCIICFLIFIGTVETTFAGSEDTIATVGVLAPIGPTGVAIDSFGNLYYADTGNNKVVMTDAAGTIILTIGTGVAGFTPFISTSILTDPIKLNAPTGVAVDAAGNLYIADTGNHRVHMVTANTTTKLITGASAIKTVAGNGLARYLGDDAVATAGSLRSPTGVAVDPTGKILFIADNGNYRIRKVDATGKITTFLGDGSATTLTPYSMAFSPAGDLFIADSGNNRILKITAIKGVLDGKTLPVSVAGTGTAGYSGDGGLATLALLNQPSGIATDGTDLYISDTMNACIRKVSLMTGVISTRAGSATHAQIAISAVAPGIPVGALLPVVPVGIALDSTGNVFIADSSNNFIEKIYASISAITTASPPGGTYTTTQRVTLTTSKAATIKYQLTDPTTGVAGVLTTYTGPIQISGPAIRTLTFSSTDFAGHPEVTNTATYTFDNTAPTTTALPAGSAIPYSTAQLVTLASNDPNATIYYTITGTAPTTASTKYTAPIPIPINKTTTLMYFGVDQSGNQEAVKTQVYTVDSVAPTTQASVLTGTYTDVKTVTLTSDDPKAAVYFTTDGTTPTISSAKYMTPLLINKSTILRYFAVDLAGNAELVKEQDYTLITLTTTASPRGGTFNSFQTVSLAANGVGAKIYYTIDGTTPTNTSPTYTTPILMANNSTTLQFFQVDSAGITESVKAEIYTIDFTAPTTVATCGASANTIALTATDSLDPLPKIKYIANTATTFTRNGAAVAVPSYTLTDYSSLVTFTNNTIVKFFAVDAVGNTEQMKTVYCPEVIATAPAPVPDINPSLYIDTLLNGATTSSTTMYISGNVAPFATATLDIKNGAGLAAVVPTSTTDGSFSYRIDPLVAGANVIITTATNGVATTVDTRTINQGGAVTPTNLTIGTGNGVIGHVVRVPITFNSGYQAAALSIDIAYDPSTSKLSNPAVEIANAAAASGKSIGGGIPYSGVYRILIVDNPGSTTIKAISDGVVAYLSFSILSSATVGSEPLAINSYSVIGLDANTMPVNTGVNGSVYVVYKPGNTGPGDTPVTLKGVLDALNMLLDPTAHSIDNSVDMNGDGVVQINELQQVINSFLGL